jgi:hypothetical protein
MAKEANRYKDKEIDMYDFSCLDEVKQLLNKKAQDYGNMANEPFIEERAATNIFNKALRLCNLVFKSKTANFESKDDTLRDLIGYCVLLINEYERREKYYKD